MLKRLQFRKQNTARAEASLASSGSDDGNVEVIKEMPDTKHASVEAINPDVEARTDYDGEAPNEAAQDGVRKIEAMTLTWGKKSLVGAYICMFLLYAVNAFQSSITNNLTPYVLSGFEAHSLIPAIAIVSNVMSAAVYFPIAKILDIWGRPLGFSIMATLATLGLIMMATTNGVEVYAAAQVFYSLGFTGMIYTVDVITADTSSLRDRALAYACTASPFIITAMSGPVIAESFYEKISWRWAFGTFAIILPLVATPFLSILLVAEHRAKQKGILTTRRSGRTWLQSIWHYLVQFDALGVFLLSAGLVLFLLPFTIAGAAADQWRSPHIIAMLVLGLVLLVAFGLCQRFISPIPFVPWHLITNRTVIGVCMLDAAFQIAYYCWASYFSSYLQVVNDLTITQAGWVAGVYDIIAGIWLFPVGYLIRRTGHFKWILVIAVPVYMLGVGLLIYFRRPDQSVGYIIMCQVFIALSGSTMTLIFQVAILSVSEHKDVAALLALLGLFGWVGGAIGNSISGAVWTHTLPEQLAKLLPVEELPNLDTIYEDLSTQLSYPVGSPTRDAIIAAYGFAQKRMLIAGTGVMVMGLFAVLLIQDIKVTKKQMKGMIF